MTKFISCLPSTTIICITLLGHEYVRLLKNLLSHQGGVEAWMLISRKSAKKEPIVMLFPIDTILQGTLYL